MKITFPQQQIKMDRDTGIDPDWYEKLKLVERWINSGALATGALAANAVTGFAYLPVISGPPTGVPLVQPGYAAMAVQLGSPDKMWIYDGTAWKSTNFT